MAHTSWNEKDLIKEDFTESYCAFIDILGYKAKSEQFFQNRYNLFKRVERALKTIDMITHMSSFLMDLSDLKVRFFSDSIIISVPVRPYGLAAVFHFTTSLATNLSFEDLFVRGGISKGKHFETVTYSGSPFLASEALQKAYILESKEAINPRILIDPALIDGLYPEEKDFVIKEKEKFIAHFAQVLINREGNNPDDVFAEMFDIQNAMKSETENSVKTKYQWVLDYYFWTICSSNNFDIPRYEQFYSGTDRGFEKISCF